MVRFIVSHLNYLFTRAHTVTYPPTTHLPNPSTHPHMYTCILMYLQIEIETTFQELWLKKWNVY